ncbi:hypothetical protein ACFPJ1_01800 [Kribbella qitaiheensis]|uniref:hypothetical protein n=1 Tax=Kribbella qitaiheensis TaxID=1544730 RepID=UPI0036081E2D
MPVVICGVRAVGEVLLRLDRPDEIRVLRVDAWSTLPLSTSLAALSGTTYRSLPTVRVS